ncbi:MAG TPA: methyltransferase domain-containing protein [Methylomirabilota bacterium]|jgi:ubiquinone/menaquinone biosynthesis C-methylase UbiE|nr:methyltransferase domain-containing protein [Methylomirabilota bacterium]
MGRTPPAEAWQGYKASSFERLELVEGDHVLDVGCGTGEDALEIARRVPGVAVIGVDVGEEKIAEARRRSLGVPRPVDFRVGDAYRLPFEAASFDACRADKVFHHLDDPAKALAEMIRVARSGARIVVSDVDYDTLIVEAPDRALTRRILSYHCDRMPSGAIGRRLPQLFQGGGLGAVEVFPTAVTVSELDDSVLKLRDKAEAAATAGVVSAAEAARWLASLEDADRAGGFLCAVTVFTVRGRLR